MTQIIIRFIGFNFLQEKVSYVFFDKTFHNTGDAEGMLDLTEPNKGIGCYLEFRHMFKGVYYN